MNITIQQQTLGVIDGPGTHPHRFDGDVIIDRVDRQDETAESVAGDTYGLLGGCGGTRGK